MRARDKRTEIRRAVADLIWTAGCGCCGDRKAFQRAEARLAKLLRVPMYDDKSGYDFGRFRTRSPSSGERNT